MKAYLDILQNCLDHGTLQQNRTGTPAIRHIGAVFEHDMKDGFPLITTKKMGLKNIATELEFFINGYTDKKWLQDRNCHIWDEWANTNTWKPIYGEIVCNLIQNYNFNLTDNIKQELENTVINGTRNLGPIYGWQWRHFGGEYVWNPKHPEQNFNPKKPGIDQIKEAIDMIKADPSNRRAYVTAANPSDKDKMALEPCHIMHHILVNNGKLNLIWTQRSCDMFLGVPYNIASYALLLMLYAKELGYEPGILRGELHDVHIYENHLGQVKTQLLRQPNKLPTVEITTQPRDGLHGWTRDDFNLKNYVCHPALKGEVAR